MALASPDTVCYLSGMRKSFPDKIPSQPETRSKVAGLLVLSMVLSMVLSTVVFTGCVSDPEDPDRILTSNHYTNKVIGFDFAFPATWLAKLDQTFGNTKVDVVVAAPPRNNFSSNLNLIISPHSGPAAMQEILPMLESAIKGQTVDAAGYTASIGTIDGKEVGRIDYESSVSGNLLHFSMLVFINNNKDVVVTLTDRAEDFPTNTGIAAIKASFHIIPK